jgi:predicted aspartyl protease
MRSRPVIIFFALSLLGASIGAIDAVEPTGDLASLVEAHLRWLGGRETLTQLQDLTRTGTFKSAGFKGRTVLRETRNGWTHHEMEGGPVSRVAVVGAGGSWTVTDSGQVEMMGAHATELGRRRTLRHFAVPLLDLGAAGPSDLGSETHDGKSWRVVRIDYQDGDSYDLFLDPADGSCTWARETNGAETHWEHFTHWRRVAGLRVPFEERGIYPDPKEDYTLRWASAATNQGLTATSFERPLPRKEIVHFADGAASTAWLPLDMVDGFHMFVRGTVAGQVSDIALDSGAQVTVLSQPFAKQLRLKQSGHLRLTGTVKAQGASLAPGVDVQIGTLSLSKLTVVVTDLREAETMVGRSIAAIVGHELFNDAVVDIDYPGARIAFHDPARYQPEPEARRVRLLPGDSGDMLVEASVEGLPPALFSIDTGSDDTVALFGSFVEKNGLLEKHSPRSRIPSYGLGGSREATIATLKTFNIGGLELHDMPAQFHDAEEGAFSARHIAGNLGAEVLKRFRVVLDRSHGVMYLLPTAGWDSKPFWRNRVGLEVRSQGGNNEVTFVAPGSPAAAANWKIGERIVAIHIDLAGPPQPIEDWRTLPAGTKVDIKDGTGAVRTLVLADYY